MSDLLVAALAAGAAAVVVSEPGQRTARAAIGKAAEAIRPTRLELPSGLQPYRAQIIAAAWGNGIKPSLLAALSLQENRRSQPNITLANRPESWIVDNKFFNRARAQGWSNAQLSTVYGLCQIKGATAIAVGYKGLPAGLLDPKANLELAARYLARQIRQQGNNIRMGLVRYNGGNVAANAVRRGAAHFSAKYADMVLARQRLLEAGETARALTNDPRRIT